MPYALAIAALTCHLATSARYGYFRDELYFIACSKRLSWGYVDQPPLVAVAAWISAPFHYNLIALRFLPAVAGALTVWLAAKLAREFGGGTFAQTSAALATLLVPAYLLLGNTLTTTSFEPFSWTLLIYIFVRLVRSGDPRYWIAAAAAFTFGMYGKYSMALLGVSLLCGLLLTRERRTVFTRWFALAIALTAVLLAPNALWQGAHGWPFAQVVAGDFQHRHAFQNGLNLEYRNFAQNALAFSVEQGLYTNPFALPLWVTGLVVLASERRIAHCRFIAAAFLVLFVLAVWLEAKGYYLIGVYAALIAAGSVAVERHVVRPALRAVLACAFVAFTLVFVPISLPVLPVDAFISYAKFLHLTGQRGTQARLIQPVYAEEFGWSELARHVARVYDRLPRPLRLRTGIFADTYADAGALDFYGPRYGLPPAISAQNTYYLWGPRGYDGSSLIVVGASQAALVRTMYRHMQLVTTYGNPYTWVVEGPTPIYLCSDPIAPLSHLWPRLRWYGA